MSDYKTVSERFWAKVKKDPSGCWLWIAARHNAGYGWFKAGRKNPELAHRVAFRLTRGRDPGPLLCHTCDVRLCVNPDHVYEGTTSDNARDSVARGRHAKASLTVCAKGHEFTPLNTTVYITKRGTRMRQCKTCKAGWDSARRAKKRLALEAKR